MKMKKNWMNITEINFTYNSKMTAYLNMIITQNIFMNILKELQG